MRLVIVILTLLNVFIKRAIVTFDSLRKLLVPGGKPQLRILPKFNLAVQILLLQLPIRITPKPELLRIWCQMPL